MEGAQRMAMSLATGEDLDYLGDTYGVQRDLSQVYGFWGWLAGLVGWEIYCPETDASYRERIKDSVRWDS